MYGTVFSILYSVLCRLRQWRDFLAMHIYPAGFNLQTFALHYFWFCSITGQRESQPGMSGGCTAYRFWCIVQWHGHTWVQSIAGQKQRETESYEWWVHSIAVQINCAQFSIALNWHYIALPFGTTLHGYRAERERATSGGCTAYRPPVHMLSSFRTSEPQSPSSSSSS